MSNIFSTLTIHVSYRYLFIEYDVWSDYENTIILSKDYLNVWSTSLSYILKTKTTTMMSPSPNFCTKTSNSILVFLTSFRPYQILKVQWKITSHVMSHISLYFSLNETKARLYLIETTWYMINKSYTLSIYYKTPYS